MNLRICALGHILFHPCALLVFVVNKLSQQKAHMDPSDINFPLQSGFSNIAESVGDNDVLRIKALTLVFIQDSMRAAAELAEARGSDVVTTSDTLMALKLTSMPGEDGQTYWDRHPDWFERTQRLENEMMGYDDHSESDSGSIDVGGDGTSVAAPAPGYEADFEAELDAEFEEDAPSSPDMSIEDLISDAIASATYLTMDMTDINERWDAWNPPIGSMDCVLKKAVLNTVEHFTL